MSVNSPPSLPKTLTQQGPAVTREGFGLFYALAAYIIWGALPLYFILLSPANAFEIVAWRVVFAFVFCGVLLTVTRKWATVISLLRSPRTLLILGAAGVLIFFNWQSYVIGALTGHIVEASLGYFINPLMTIFLGVVFLNEKLRKLQWVAVCVSVIAVIILTVGYGSPPWLALILALTFSLYGLVKKRVGTHVDALAGLTVETLWLLPVAIVELVIVTSFGAMIIGTQNVGHTAAMLGIGIVTAVPLLFFAAAARRLPLVYLGFLQYVTPIIQFAIGVAVFHEAMPPERWIGFGLVWFALLLLTADAVGASRLTRRGTLPASV